LLRIGRLSVTNSPALKTTENPDREIMIIEFTHALREGCSASLKFIICQAQLCFELSFWDKLWGGLDRSIETSIINRDLFNTILFFLGSQFF